MRPVPRFAWPRTVESVLSLPDGPGTPSSFSRRAIARGLAPSANSRNTRRTVSASVSLMRRSPRTGSPAASTAFTTS